MVSAVEETICLKIISVLEELEQGNNIIDSEAFKEILSSLEHVISYELREKYTEWKYESIDGIYVNDVSKIDFNQLGFIGMCIMISDQSLIPIYVEIKISDSKNKIDWMNCKLAEQERNNLIKIPYDSNRWRKRLLTLDVKDIDKINWHYSINYVKSNEN